MPSDRNFIHQGWEREADYRLIECSNLLLPKWVLIRVLLKLLAACREWLFVTAAVLYYMSIFPLYCDATVTYFSATFLMLLSGKGVDHKPIKSILSSHSVEFRKLLHLVLFKTVSRTLFTYPLRSSERPQMCEVKDGESQCSWLIRLFYFLGLGCTPALLMG